MVVHKNQLIKDNYSFLVTQSIENKKVFAESIDVSYSYLKNVLLQERKQRIVDNYIDTIDGDHTKYIETMNHKTPLADAILNEFDIKIPKSKAIEPKEVNELPNGKIQLIYESKMNYEK